MPTSLKVVRVFLILCSIPGMLVSLFAGMVVASLIYDEMHPDPDNIGHGMGMLALFPMAAWAVLGLVWIGLMWVLWLVIKKMAKQEQP